MAKRRILFVDDDASILKTVGKRLEFYGFDVAVVSDPVPAVAQAQAQRPDLIVLDLELPGLDGFDICRALKADAQCRMIPIVIFTGKGEGQDDERAKAAGAAAYVNQLEGTGALLQRINTILGA